MVKKNIWGGLILPSKSKEKTSKSKENWAIGVITIFIGLFSVAVYIITQNWDNTSKAIGCTIIGLVGYITYNEFSKLFAK